MHLAKLIAALMSPDLDLMSAIEQRLSEQYGTIELISDVYAFDPFTDYYAQEMGVTLQKKFISFAEMIPMDALADIKLFTNGIEQEYAADGKRRINIDPGYVTHAQMVLATTKPYSHRIYLGQGIYAELTYLCKGKFFCPLEWTYPDYRVPLAIEFFQHVRRKYLQYTRSQNSIKIRRHTG